MTNRKKLVVESIEGTLEYPKLRTAAPKYRAEEGNEFVTNVVLTENQEEMVRRVMEKHNIPETTNGHPFIKTDKNGRKFIKLRRNELSMTGKKNTIPVTDSSGKELAEDVLIGNGTTAKVEMLIFQKKNSTESGVRLSAVEVVDLVEYKPESKAGASFEDDDSVIM